MILSTAATQTAATQTAAAPPAAGRPFAGLVRAMLNSWLAHHQRLADLGVSGDL